MGAGNSWAVFKSNFSPRAGQPHVEAPLTVLCWAEEAFVLNLKKDIQAMTTFRRNPKKFLNQLKKTKKPIILRVNGKAEAVVQDAEAYQRLMDIAAQADEMEGIRQ